MIGKMLSMKEQWHKPSLPREVSENAVAAAKLGFNQGGRKSVDLWFHRAPKFPS